MRGAGDDFVGEGVLGNGVESERIRKEFSARGVVNRGGNVE